MGAHDRPQQLDLRERVHRAARLGHLIRQLVHQRQVPLVVKLRGQCAGELGRQFPSKS